VTIRWVPYRIEAAGIEVDVVDGVPLDAELGPERGHVLQRAEDVEIGVWYGHDGTIDRWSRGLARTWPEAVLEPEERIHLACGLPARRRVAHLPSESVEGGFRSADGSLEVRARSTPARETAAVAFVCDGVPVLASVSAAGASFPLAQHVFGVLRPLR
jgi:hypothetical protein